MHYMYKNEWGSPYKGGGGGVLTAHHPPQIINTGVLASTNHVHIIWPYRTISPCQFVV